MLYFKNRELAETYHVSDRTIRNWIEEAKRGKLSLALHELGGRSFIANTTKNLSIIEGLVSARKKFRPHHTFKVITPKPEFYKLYSEAQIYEIVSFLEIHHELPFQYSYFDGGATLWDKYIRRLAREETPNALSRTAALFEMNQGYIDSLLESYDRVNVVDIGAGNAFPVRTFLQHLVDQGKMGRYVDYDISPAMLAIAKQNIDKWFGDKVTFEGYEADVNYDRFGNLMAAEDLGMGASTNITIVLALGGTIANLRVPDAAFRIIHDSMNRKDIFLCTSTLDTSSTRQFFDFSINTNAIGSGSNPKTKLLLDMMGLDESFYDVEMGFDTDKLERYIRIRLKLALTINFNFGDGERAIDLNKNDTILIWRHRQQGSLDVIHQFDHNDFYMLHSSQTDDQEYILTVSRVKSE